MLKRVDKETTQESVLSCDNLKYYVREIFVYNIRHFSVLQTFLCVFLNDSHESVKVQKSIGS